MKTILFLGFAGFVLVSACTTTVGGGGETGGGGCAQDADCGAGKICGFPGSDACDTHGQCFPAPEALCQAYSPGCACDGTLITTVCNGLPSGFTRKPLAYTGDCVDGGPPGCCPSSFTMYDCTFPDGTAGKACHNPAMGCASSQTCGQGCDMVVADQCNGG